MRREGGTTVQEHTLSMNTPLHAREVTIKSDQNKSQLIKTICNINHGSPTIRLIDEEQFIFGHEEADVNIISYLQMLHGEKNHIQITGDDTDCLCL